MVVHVYERALQATELDEVIIAIDSELTAKAIEPYNVNAVMTLSDYRSGTDRVAAVVKDMDVNIIVNVQGDEPAIDPQLIDDLVVVLHKPNVFIATAATKDISNADLSDPNVVKVLIDTENIALDFRRSPRHYEIDGYYRHIGIYGFRKKALMQYTNMIQTENEKIHRLEQLRVLDNGLPIHVLLTEYSGRGIDTEADLDAYLEHNG